MWFDRPACGFNSVSTKRKYVLCLLNGEQIVFELYLVTS